MGKAILAALLGLLLVSCGWYGQTWPASPTPTSCSGVRIAGRCVWVASIDTMKLSKDQENTTITDAQMDNVIGLIATEHVTHITVVTHYDKPDLMYRWVQAIRRAGKQVWFRSGVRGWDQSLGPMTPDQWLAKYRTFLETYSNNAAYQSLFLPGDIMDPNAETENGYVTWCGCSIYAEPYRSNFNKFLLDQTATANDVLTTEGYAAGDILTTVHSVDIGTATGVLKQATVDASGGLVTVDTYPDQNTTDPQTAANGWQNVLSQINAKYTGVHILIGEAGYSIALNPTDQQQRDVLAAEMRMFHDTAYPLVGLNYWVGPGGTGSDSWTRIMTGSISSGWTARPGAACVGALFDEKGGGGTPLC